MTKIRPSGDYRELHSFQMATVIYDATYWFCERCLEPHSRMSDQMVQAARSGRQNIAKASRASAASSRTELRLISFARSSLEELLLDYEDFLRHRHMPKWPPDGPEALAVRKIGRKDPSDVPAVDSSKAGPSDPSAHYALYAAWLDHADPVIRANALVCLINQAHYLLDKQIEALEAQFIEEGGYSEQLATARLAERNREKSDHPSDRLTLHSSQSDGGSSQSDGGSDLPRRSPEAKPGPSTPIPPCPKCGKPMALRTAQKGRNKGKQFWGCSGYPDCKGLVDV